MLYDLIGDMVWKEKYHFVYGACLKYQLLAFKGNTFNG